MEASLVAVRGLQLLWTAGSKVPELAVCRPWAQQLQHAASFWAIELSCLVVYEILVPQQPMSPALEGQFLTTRISG